MRFFIIIILAATLISCASGGSVMKYSYLPASDYHYYNPLKPVDLKQKRFKVVISDKRERDRIDCSDFVLPRDTELEGKDGLDYFKNYLRGMIEANNGIFDQDNGQEVKVELTALSQKIYGFGYMRLYGFVEFNAAFLGKVKKYCTVMETGGKNAPVDRNSFHLTSVHAARVYVSGAVRYAFEELMYDLSALN
jgi:hypothetical protein